MQEKREESVKQKSRRYERLAQVSTENTQFSTFCYHFAAPIFTFINICVIFAANAHKKAILNLHNYTE